ncbi:MoxR family ATPase [Exilibacterium tricleocarpae]|uniref:MoxR family ATPase n=1 Tax=Exilibacterium tricleocarpae TaxID=2591008 RepID=A0A545TB98_9GAMM|nr:MoxR family ATPase [Exilibacterium tricleocarpae]TQV74489.1 MoxR family ATPase [Exilibacterium tricleocarpae]
MDHVSYPYFTGNPEKKRTDLGVGLPVSRRGALTAPEKYRVRPELVDAVNVALTLGQPLLVTGEPGTGKTQLAYYLAYELNLGAPLKFETKSTTVARDLFYQYDTVGRFQAAQMGGATQGAALGQRRGAVDYIEYQALGKAILFANAPGHYQAATPGDFQHPGQRRSLVLIDEIDKAPRDVPNDILNEIEGMYFKVPELGNLELQAEPAYAPVVVITSNSEKSLPAPFLRRCTYFHMPAPSEQELREIVSLRLEAFDSTSPLLTDALKVMEQIQLPRNGFERKPGTSELLNWLLVLMDRGYRVDDHLRRKTDWIDPCVTALFKLQNDQSKARKLLPQLSFDG